MTNSKNDSAITALLIFSSLPEEVSLSDAEAILTESGAADQFSASACIEDLCSKGHLYIEEGTDGTKHLGLTELGDRISQALSDKKDSYSDTICAALRAHRRLTTGIEFRVSLRRADGDGSYVRFEKLKDGALLFSTEIFFEKSSDALGAHNRMNADPDSFFSGFMTVVTGDIGYLM